MKNPHTKFSKYIWLVFLSLLAAIVSTHAQTIAYWRFEDGNFTADSSGNGHALNNSGAIVETASLPSTFAGGINTGAASFSNAAIMNTLANLDLTPYSEVTIEWFMLADLSEAAFVWTHTPFIFPGGIAVTINYIGGPNSIDARVLLDLDGSVSAIAAPVPGGNNPGVWQHFALYVDTEDLSNFQLLINGVVASGEPYPFTGIGYSLADSVFYLGDTGGGGAPYTGLIDEFRISQGLLNPDQFLNVIPEPSVYSMLLGYAGAVLLISRRRFFSK